MEKKKKEIPFHKDGIVIGTAPEITHDLIPGLAYHSTWSNPEQFSRHVAKLDRKKAWHDSGWDGDQDFTGTKNMGEALHLAEGNWKEGAEQVAELRSKVLAFNPMRVQSVKYDLAGSYPCVPRAVAGNPFNMRAPDLSRSKRRPTITLICNMSVPWFVEKEKLSNRAACIAAIVDQIEAAGYSCEVISTGLTQSYKDFTAGTSVIVKDSGKPVDTARLAYGLGHSSMFRRLVFADWGSEPACKALGGGLGCAGGNLIRDDLKEKNIYRVPDASDEHNKYATIETASKEGMEFIINSLREQGCPAFQTRH